MNIKSIIPQRIKNYYYIFRRPKKCRKKLKFGIDIVKHCNLNCKGCDHFSCISEKIFADVDTTKKDLLRIKEIFGEDVEQINLLGGEPLLNDQIGEYCELIRSLYPYVELRILTNGTLIPKVKDHLWEVFNRCGVIIVMTQYPIAFNYENAKKIILDHGIRLEYMNCREEEKTMYCVPLDIKGKQNAKISFRACAKGNQCIALENGKLYTCTLVPNIFIFNERFNQKLSVSKKDYVDIYDDLSAEQILEKLSKEIPFCRYCNQLSYRAGIKWEPSKKNIDEWT